MKRALVGTACALILAIGGAAQPARAGLTLDPTGDFLGSYTGARAGDLDVTGVEVFYDGTNFTLTAVMAADIGTTSSAFYVWGVNRGGGTPGFPTLAPGVLFDSVVILRPNGGASTANGTALAAGAVTFSGHTLTAVVPKALLPNNGFTFTQYQFNLWPRDATQAGLAAISDFAPNNSSIGITAPEPSTMALAAIGAVFALARFRRSRKVA